MPSRPAESGSAYRRAFRRTARDFHAGQQGADDPVEVPAAELNVGDRVLPRPGTRIPADGLIESEPAAVDESMLTGEAIPCGKQAGDEVIGGSLNTDGWAVVRITAAGSQTGAGRDHQDGGAGRSGPPVRRLATGSAVFVPSVLVIALITLATWLAVGYASGEKVRGPGKWPRRRAAC